MPDVIQTTGVLYSQTEFQMPSQPMGCWLTPGWSRLFWPGVLNRVTPIFQLIRKSDSLFCSGWNRHGRIKRWFARPSLFWPGPRWRLWQRICYIRRLIRCGGPQGTDQQIIISIQKERHYLRSTVRHCLPFCQMTALITAKQKRFWTDV